MATAPHAFLVGFKGITVPQVTDLRDRVREHGGQYEVVKNTLALIAIKDQPMGDLSDHFTGPTAVAYTGEDVVGLAKALTEFRKEVPAIEFKAGLVDGKAVSTDELEDIAKMPSREELMAKLLFLLQSPVTRFARVLNALTRDFVVVLNQIAEKKEA
ncbi:MAG: 50S ribosomal protein L10 [Thermoanaerobaculia bacterium]|nr:50S ribosomal protein L10 [Thermoanaerobaculia bacterium]